MNYFVCNFFWVKAILKLSKALSPNDEIKMNKKNVITFFHIDTFTENLEHRLARNKIWISKFVLDTHPETQIAKKSQISPQVCQVLFLSGNDENLWSPVYYFWGKFKQEYMCIFKNIFMSETYCMPTRSPDVRIMNNWNYEISTSTWLWMCVLRKSLEMLCAVRKGGHNPCHNLNVKYCFRGLGVPGVFHSNSILNPPGRFTKWS